LRFALVKVAQQLRSWCDVMYRSYLRTRGR